MSYDEDYKLNSKTEEYLQNNEGNLDKYYRALGNNTPFRMAFENALAAPDRVRLRMAGKLSNLQEHTDKDIPDDDVVLEIIEYLEGTKYEYPESHPIWKTR